MAYCLNTLKTTLAYRVFSYLVSMGAFIAQAKAEDYPVFAEQTVSKNTVYVGEQVLYDFALNTRTPLFDFQPPELSVAHAWTETIAVNQRLRKIINGDVWSSFATRRAVYPLTAGNFSFPTLKVIVGLRVRSKRQAVLPFGFEDAFSDQIIEEFFAEYARKEVTLTAPEAHLSVKSLPEKPATVANSQSYIPVGATHITSQFEKGELSLGESSLLQVTLISTGNLNPVKEIPLNLPDTIRSYPESAKEEKNENNGALISRKIFRITLVPRAPGIFTIPPISITYFDPDKETFQIAQSRELSLTVHGSAADLPLSAPDIAVATPQIIQSTPTPEPIPVAREDFWLKLDQTVSFESRIFLGVAGAISIALALAFITLKRRSKPLRDAEILIKNARDAGELSESIRMLLQKEFNIPAKNFSYEEWVSLLNAQVLSPDLHFSLLSLIDKLETLKLSNELSPTAFGEEQKRETLRVISAILQERRRVRKS